MVAGAGADLLHSLGAVLHPVGSGEVFYPGITETITNGICPGQSVLRVFQGVAVVVVPLLYQVFQSFTGALIFPAVITDVLKRIEAGFKALFSDSGPFPSIRVEIDFPAVFVL